VSLGPSRAPFSARDSALSSARPSAPSWASAPPRPPGADVPATCEVPHFAPVRVRGGGHRLRRFVRHRQRALAAGLALAAAALLAVGPPGPGEPPGGDRARGHPVADRASGREPGRGPGRPGVARVAAPVRIADAATVRLLRPGDRVDVIAAEDWASGGEARVVARGARVARVPEPLDGTGGAVGSDGFGSSGGSGGPGGSFDGGALVVLSVPRDTAARLVGASATARLAVTLC